LEEKNEVKNFNYLTINISDSKLYSAIINRVAEEKCKGNRSITIRQLVEEWCWKGLNNAK
jgi:hypothetical protein